MGYSDISQLFKDIKGVVDATANSELNGKVIELQGYVMDLMDRELKLKEDNDAIKKKLDYEKRISMNKNNVVILDGDESKPYCPKCWGRDRKLNLLGNPGDFMGLTAYSCATCGQHYVIHE